MAKLSTGVSEFQPAARGLGPVDLPGRLRYYHDINRDASRGAGDAFRHMEIYHQAAEGLNARRQMVDPTITEAMNKLQVEKAVREFRAKYTQSQANAMASMRDSLTDAENRLKTKVGVLPTSDAREIRDRLAAMPADERMATLRDAFASGDKPVIGAIVGFSKVMHGCDPAIVEPLFDKFKRDVAYSEYTAVQEHKKYLGYLELNDASVYRFATDALKGCDGYVKAKEEYDSVMKTFEQPEPDEPEAEAA